MLNRLKVRVILDAQRSPLLVLTQSVLMCVYGLSPFRIPTSIKGFYMSHQKRSFQPEKKLVRAFENHLWTTEVYALRKHDASRTLGKQADSTHGLQLSQTKKIKKKEKKLLLQNPPLPAELNHAASHRNKPPKWGTVLSPGPTEIEFFWPQQQELCLGVFKSEY